MTPAKPKSKSPLDHLKKKQPNRVIVRVITDAEATAEAADLEKQLASDKLTPRERTDLESKHRAALKRRDESVEQIVLTAPGRKAQARLEDQHPPTDEQILQWQEANGTRDPEDPTKIILATTAPAFDPETYPSALIAACIGCSVEDLEIATEDWNPAEWQMLWMAAQVCTQTSQVNWGKD